MMWPGGEVSVGKQGEEQQRVIGPLADLLGPEECVGQHVRVLPRESLTSAKLRVIAGWWHFVGRERYVITELPELTVHTEPVPGMTAAEALIIFVRVEGRGRKVRPGSEGPPSDAMQAFLDRTP